MTILITGDEGYIGCELKDKLRELEIPYKGFDLLNGLNILDSDALNEALRDVDHCIHLASIPGTVPCLEEPRKTFMVNVLGTFNVIQACLKNEVNGITFASSFAVKKPYQTNYSFQKYLGEELIKHHPIKGVTLRFSNIYGGKSYLEQKDTTIAHFIKTARQGLIDVNRPPDQSRDFLEVSDVVSALIHSIKAPAGLYDVCTGKQTKISEMLEIIKRLTGVNEVEYAYQPSGASTTGSPAEYIRTGWSPQIDLETGIKKLMAT